MTPVAPVTVDAHHRSPSGAREVSAFIRASTSSTVTVVFKTAGPARLGITDRGLTFASNGDRGVCINFHSPVPGIGRIRHPELTVTVLDVDALLNALTPCDPERER